MLKLLLFITIIISINCAAKTMSSRSLIDIENDRQEFYRQVEPISRVRHSGDLPLLSASEMKAIIYGLVQVLDTSSQYTENSKNHRELLRLRDQLVFRLKYKLYKPENSNDKNNVQMVRTILVFD